MICPSGTPKPGSPAPAPVVVTSASHTVAHSSGTPLPFASADAVACPLSVQSANGIYSAEDRMQIQVEVSQLIDEIDRVASHGQFNGMTLLTGRFAAETGGKLHEASELGTLRLASFRVKDELKTQYRLGYVPRDSRQDGRFRRIEVYVRLENVQVRTRKGYYARADKRGAGESNTQAVPVQDPHINR